MAKTAKNFSHLNDAIPMLTEANARRKADAEKAEQAKEATKLAKKMLSVGKRGVR